MKIKQIIVTSSLLLVLFSCIFYFLYFPTSKTKGKKVKNKFNGHTTITVKNTFIEYEISAIGKICKQENVDIRFAVSGELLDGETKLEEGSEFKKNQLLFRLDNLDAFSALANKKIELGQLFKSLIPQLDLKFGKEKEKWLDFLEEIKPVKRLPDLPSLLPPEERIFLIENQFMQAYVKTKMLETEMEKYFYIAPFDGKCIQLNVSSGEKVDPETTIATVFEHKELLSKVTINKENKGIFKDHTYVSVLNNTNKKITQGKFLRCSKKKGQKDKMEVFYSLPETSKSKAQANSKIKIKLKEKTEEKCISVPFSAINGNIVRVLVNELPVYKTITILGKTENHYLIGGLADGEKLILSDN
jgi:hypothetical protein